MTRSRRLLVALAAALGTLLIRLLGASWRIRREGPDLAREARAGGRRFVAAFWHNRILGCCWHFRGMGVTVLISRHRDGEIIARIAERLGHRTARGSSTRGAVAGLKGLLDAAKEGDVAITPDGPRGPVYRLQPGLVDVAARTGHTVILIAWAADRAWRFASWDRFIVPKPFARIVFRQHETNVSTGLDGAGLEEARARVEGELRALTRELEEEVTGGHDERLEGGEGAAPGAGAGGGAGTRGEGRAERGAAMALVLASFLLVALIPRLLAGEAPRDPRADLASALLLACALAASLPPALLAAGRGRLALPLLLGCALGTLAAPLPSGTGLLPLALAGLATPAAIALSGLAAARLLERRALAPLLAALPGVLLLLSVFLAGPLLPLLARLPAPLSASSGEGLARLLPLSSVTALTGSLLEIDLLRAAPLYQLVRASSEAPFRYPGYALTLAPPLALAALAFLLSLARPRGGGEAAPPP
jgi:hypothetical protein